MNMDPFSYLQFGINSLSTDSNIRGTVASAFQLLSAIVMIGLVITIVLAGIKIASAPPSKRADALSEIGTKLLVGISLFGSTTAISMIYRVVASFVGNM
mgnify:CR=1 FL=1